MAAYGRILAALSLLSLIAACREKLRPQTGNGAADNAKASPAANDPLSTRPRY